MLSKAEIAKKKLLSREIRSTMALASELGYRKEDIEKFANAKSFIQLENMLIDARRNS